MLDVQKIGYLLEGIDHYAGVNSAITADEMDAIAIAQMSLYNLSYYDQRYFQVPRLELQPGTRFALMSMIWRTAGAHPEQYGPGVARDANDGHRVIRLVNEVSMLHLGLLPEDFDKGIADRTRELKEISTMDVEMIPVKRDPLLTATLAAFGFTNDLHWLKDHAHDGANAVLPIPQTKPDMWFVKPLHAGVVEWAGDNASDITIETFCSICTANWLCLDDIDNRRWKLFQYQEASAENTAKLAYCLFKNFSMANPRNATPLGGWGNWEGLIESFREGLILMVKECYNWLLSDRAGPPSAGAMSAIKTLTGDIQQPWLHGFNNPLSRVMLIAAIIMPPTRGVRVLH